MTRPRVPWTMSGSRIGRSRSDEEALREAEVSVPAAGIFDDLQPKGGGPLNLVVRRLTIYESLRKFSHTSHRLFP